MGKKVVIAGGTGFLGHILSEWFERIGWDVIVLSRRSGEMAHARIVTWDGRSLGEWANELEGAEALINLAGRSVDCRYHSRNREAIIDSRIESTRVLGNAVGRCSTPPIVWLNSSTATIYKHTYGDPHGENGEIAGTPEAKDLFSVDVARAWEAEFLAAHVPSTRQVLLRTSIVLGDRPGTAFSVLRRLVRLGLGGKMGEGRQHVSWIHAFDFCSAVERLVTNSDSTGVFNVTAPDPVTNAEMMRLFRKTYGMPFGLPASKWMLEIGAFLMRTETELIVKSRRVVPARLLDEGFSFKFGELSSALADLA